MGVLSGRPFPRQNGNCICGPFSRITCGYTDVETVKTEITVRENGPTKEYITKSSPA